jgi:hypothetical protein
MPALLDLLRQRINEDIIRKLNSQIDGDATSARNAIAAALPLLIGGLARRANESQRQAQSLVTALEKNHDGSLLDNLGPLLDLSAGGHTVTDAGSGYAGGFSIDRCSADGDGILHHLFGDRRPAVENGISRASGLDIKKVHQLLPILATAVMSALGQIAQQQRFDADGLARMLNRERAEAEREAPGVNGGSLHDFLDNPDDGEVMEEVAQIGSAFREHTFKPAAAGR